MLASATPVESGVLIVPPETRSMPRPPEEPAPVTPPKSQQKSEEPAAAARLKKALDSPESLLKPASGKGVEKLEKLTRVRLNQLQVLAVTAVFLIVAGFGLFCLLRFGWKATVMSGTPVFLAFVLGLMLALLGLRGLIDRLLAPVYRVLNQIPPKYRLVAGLTLPMAWCFWDSADNNMGFTSARNSVFIATMLGHVALRSLAFRQAPSPPSKAALVLGWLALSTALGLADDCSSPEDAMDTIWLGPPIKGIISTVIAVAVNGSTIFSKPSGPPPEDGQKPDKQTRIVLKVDTEGARTELAIDDPEGIWCYATVEVSNPPEGFSVEGAIASIGFSGADWLELGNLQQRAGKKAVYVTAVKRGEGAPAPKATLTVNAVLNGEPVTAPIEFTLLSDLRLEVETWSEWEQRS